jgi:hypothetical protein
MVALEPGLAFHFGCHWQELMLLNGKHVFNIDNAINRGHIWNLEQIDRLYSVTHEHVYRVLCLFHDFQYRRVTNFMTHSLVLINMQRGVFNKNSRTTINLTSSIRWYCLLAHEQVMQPWAFMTTQFGSHLLKSNEGHPPAPGTDVADDVVDPGAAVAVAYDINEIVFSLFIKFLCMIFW